MTNRAAARVKSGTVLDAVSRALERDDDLSTGEDSRERRAKLLSGTHRIVLRWIDGAVSAEDAAAEIDELSAEVRPH